MFAPVFIICFYPIVVFWSASLSLINYKMRVVGDRHCNIAIVGYEKKKKNSLIMVQKWEFYGIFFSFLEQLTPIMMSQRGKIRLKTPKFMVLCSMNFCQVLLLPVQWACDLCYFFSFFRHFDPSPFDVILRVNSGQKLTDGNYQRM